MKKAKKKIIFAMLAILGIAGIAICLAVIHKHTQNEANRKSLASVLPGHTDYVQLAYGAVQCMELAEKSGMKIDSDVREELREFVTTLHEIYESAEYGGLFSLELIQLGYLYSYFDLDCTQLQKELDGFYVGKERLFAYIGSDDADQLVADASSSADYMKILFDTGSNLLGKYEIKQGLEEWFNEKAAEGAKKEEDWLTLYDILFYTYTSEHSVKNLNYMCLQTDALAYLEDTRQEMGSYEVSIWNVGSLDDAVFQGAVFGYEEDFLTASRQMYGMLASREAFGYDVTDEYALLIMSFYLREHYLLTGSIHNDFLAENLNGMLHEHFETYCKGRIGE